MQYKYSKSHTTRNTTKKYKFIITLSWAAHVIFTIIRVLYKIIYFILADILFRYAIFLLKPILKLIMFPLYKLWLKAVRKHKKIFHAHNGKHINKFTFFATSKYAWHIVVSIIILGVATNNVLSKDFHPEEFGKRSLFAKLTVPEEAYPPYIEEDFLGPSTAAKRNIKYEKYFGALSINSYIPSEEKVTIAEAVTTEGGTALINPQIHATFDTPIPRAGITSYIVESGDTVSGIAEKFNISVNTILWANNKTSRSILRPGDSLRILPVSGLEHTVKSGENISLIAKKYNVPAEDIEFFNDNTNVLKIGQILIIPGGKKIAPPPAVKPKPAPEKQFVSSDPSGAMFWPASCRRISQNYLGWKHTGVDIACGLNKPIYAAEDGVVEKATWGTGYGNMIVIKHNDGLKTLYAHINKGGILVDVGDTVTKGQKIANMGSTGRSTGPHLHFEVIVDGSRENPMNYL